MRKLAVFFIIFLLISASVFAAGKKEEGKAEITEVKLGVLPFFDYAWGGVPVELGWDKELGLDLELVWFPLEGKAVQALVSGSIDLTLGAVASFIPLYPKIPELRVFLCNVQFKGFAIECRKGEFKTYYDYLEELGDEEKAVEAAVKQMKGKTFIFQRSTAAAVFASVLEQGGLTLDDIDIIDMEQAEGAAAFARGVGDFYNGGFPQHRKLRNMESGEFIPFLEHEQMGPAGLWFSNAAAPEAYLAENKDTILKISALAYRTARYIREKPKEALSIIGEVLNKHAAADFSYEDLKDMADRYVYYATLEESKEKFLNPKALGYWRKSAEYQLNKRIEIGDLKEGDVDLDKLVDFDTTMRELENSPELMNFINKPF